MKNNKWNAIATGAGLAAMLAATAVHADDMYATAVSAERKWEVRLRIDYLDPANHSNAITGLLPEDAITINTKWLPDLDFEYFFTPHWSTELVLTYPQSQTVYVQGQSIGTFKHLPPTLTGK